MTKKNSSGAILIIGLTVFGMLAKYWYLFFALGVVTLAILLIAKYFKTNNINTPINSTKTTSELHLRVTCDACEDSTLIEDINNQILESDNKSLQYKTSLQVIPSASIVSTSQQNDGAAIDRTAATTVSAAEKAAAEVTAKIKTAEEKENRIPVNELPQHENKSAPLSALQIPSSTNNHLPSVIKRENGYLAIKLNICGYTAYCSNYGKSCCSMPIEDSCYDTFRCFSPRSPRTSSYGSLVNGHFRRSKNGKLYWVKSHTRRN